MSPKDSPNLGALAIEYQGQALRFYPTSEVDHIAQYIREKKAFYEADVLEKIQALTSGRAGMAIDAGAFIGTHSVFFGKFCDCEKVVAFEANPATFPFLERNVRANGLAGKIVPIHKALGASSGFAHIAYSREGNQGNTILAFDDGKADIEVAALDDELRSRADPSPVKLIKIDVEGAEIAVLRGAMETIRASRPLLCIEIHRTRHMLAVLMQLRGNGYLIVDCLGMSPTYLFRAGAGHAVRRYLSNAIWVVRSLIPSHLHNRIRWYLKRLAQTVAGSQ
jgi:protein O-GlcNAc transferase